MTEARRATIQSNISGYPIVFNVVGEQESKDLGFCEWTFKDGTTMMLDFATKTFSERKVQS